MYSKQRQLTARSLVIGAVGSAIITASSMYIALKLGALPWPIVFAALVSLFLLKRFGNTNLNEVNVAHTAMSAGAMIAGGLAFTIPGIWMLDPSASVDLWQLVVIALSGTVLGSVFTALMHSRFIDESDLDYPIGVATADSLIAANEGGSRAKQLFGAMTVSGVYAVIRDWFGALPSIFLGTGALPGVSFGIYNSPMMLAIGFMVGTSAVLVWFIGALIGNFGIVTAGSGFGLWSVTIAEGIRSSLGMGCMIGCGVGVIGKNLISSIRKRRESRPAGEDVFHVSSPFGIIRFPFFALALAAVAVVICFALGLGPVPAVVVVGLTWLAATMSTQSVGETGVDPMEVFGAMVLLAVAAFSGLSQVRLFFVAAIVAVACGLVGDVMNDFKVGHIIGTDPKSQWIAQAVGAVVGAVVAAAVLLLLVHAYGTGAFGTDKTFIAAQAQVVATLVSGIPNLPAFVIGFALCAVLYIVGVPVITLGIGIYLPFYMSFTAFLGLLARLVASRFLPDSEETTGLVAAGVLGGESIVGVLLALVGIFVR